MVLLEGFRPVFAAPSFNTFHLLMTGWVLSVRRRYVTDLIISSDSVGNGHFSDYHGFFSQAKWNLDELWRILARLLVNQLVGPDAVIILAGDGENDLASIARFPYTELLGKSLRSPMPWEEVRHAMDL